MLKDLLKEASPGISTKLVSSVPSHLLLYRIIVTTWHVIFTIITILLCVLTIIAWWTCVWMTFGNRLCEVIAITISCVCGKGSYALASLQSLCNIISCMIHHVDGAGFIILCLEIFLLHLPWISLFSWISWLQATFKNWWHWMLHYNAPNNINAMFVV